MTECFLNLSKLDQEHRDHFVFYASHETIVYKDRRSLVANNCSGSEIVRIDCPSSYKAYEVIDLGDALLMIFSGKHLVYIDKFGSASFSEELPINRVGRVLSEIFPSNYDDSIIFSGHMHKKVHFINYNFINKKRICQSASWEVGQVNDIECVDGKIYSLMDSAYLVCCDCSTGETLWTRFETGTIKPRIIPYDDGLIYSCQKLIKVYKDKNVDIIRVPLARPDTLESIRGDKLYYTARDKKHLCCLDLSTKELEWEITGTEEIKKTITVQGKLGGTIVDVMVLQTPSTVTVINLSQGRVHSYFKVVDLQNIRQTGDHILIHRKFDKTDMLSGVPDA